MECLLRQAKAQRAFNQQRSYVNPQVRRNSKQWSLAKKSRITLLHRHHFGHPGRPDHHLRLFDLYF